MPELGSYNNLSAVFPGDKGGDSGSPTTADDQDIRLVVNPGQVYPVGVDPAPGFQQVNKLVSYSIAPARADLYLPSALFLIIGVILQYLLSLLEGHEGKFFAFLPLLDTRRPALLYLLDIGLEEIGIS